MIVVTILLATSNTNDINDENDENDEIFDEFKQYSSNFCDALKNRNMDLATSYLQLIFQIFEQNPDYFDNHKIIKCIDYVLKFGYYGKNIWNTICKKFGKQFYISENPNNFYFYLDEIHIMILEANRTSNITEFLNLYNQHPAHFDYEIVKKLIQINSFKTNNDFSENIFNFCLSKYGPWIFEETIKNMKKNNLTNVWFVENGLMT